MITVKRFTGAWCQPCKVIAPIVEQLKQELTDVNFEVYDVDVHPTKTIEYDIKSLPTLVIEKNGEVVHKIVGLVTKASLISTINSFK